MQAIPGFCDMSHDLLSRTRFCSRALGKQKNETSNPPDDIACTPVFLGLLPCPQRLKAALSRAVVRPPGCTEKMRIAVNVVPVRFPGRRTATFVIERAVIEC